jgi:hypothetical protein
MGRINRIRVRRVDARTGRLNVGCSDECALSEGNRRFTGWAGLTGFALGGSMRGPDGRASGAAMYAR